MPENTNKNISEFELTVKRIESEVAYSRLFTQYSYDQHEITCCSSC
jgi:hypothetical protein